MLPLEFSISLVWRVYRGAVVLLRESAVGVRNVPSLPALELGPQPVPQFVQNTYLTLSKSVSVDSQF